MEFQKYDSLKETGHEWLGDIPESWKLVKAKWLFKEKSIKGYPVERLLSVSKGKGLIPRDELEFKTVMAFKDLENFKLVKKNDFVIHLRSFQSGFEMSVITGIVSPAYTVFEGKENVYPYYYKYLFYMKHFIDAIASTTQSLRDGKPIAYGEFAKMELPLPAKEEQSKISDFLNEKLQSLDKLISYKIDLINLLEEKRQAMITEAVKKGLNPDVKMKDSGVEWIGEIPEHWKINNIKHIADIHSSNVDKKSVDGEQQVLLCNYVDVYYNDEITKGLEFMKATAKKDQVEKFTLQKHDVIVTKDSESPIDIAIPTWVSENLPEVLCGYHLALIRSNKKQLSGQFLYYCLESEAIREQFYSKANGVTRFGLPKEAIKNGIITYPPLEEQKEIASYLYEMNKHIRNIEADIKIQIQKLKEYRQSLIYEAVTGKIDVRDFEVEH